MVIKQGEAKTITFTVKDALGTGVDLSGAALLLGVKKDKSEADYTFAKADQEFDKSQAARRHRFGKSERRGHRPAGGDLHRGAQVRLGRAGDQEERGFLLADQAGGDGVKIWGKRGKGEKGKRDRSEKANARFPLIYNQLYA